MARAKGFHVSMIVPTAHLASVLDHVADKGVGDLQIHPLAKANGNGTKHAKGELRAAVLAGFDTNKAMSPVAVAEKIGVPRAMVQGAISGLVANKSLKRSGRGQYKRATA